MKSQLSKLSMVLLTIFLLVKIVYNPSSGMEFHELKRFKSEKACMEFKTKFNFKTICMENLQWMKD